MKTIVPIALATILSGCGTDALLMVTPSFNYERFAVEKSTLLATAAAESSKSECPTGAAASIRFSALNEYALLHVSALKTRYPLIADDRVFASLTSGAFKSRALAPQGAALQLSKVGEPSGYDLTNRDFRKFSENLATFDPIKVSSAWPRPRNARSETAIDGGNPSFGDVLLLYYDRYIRGKFVDRFGNQIEKPDIKNGLTGGTISGFVRVFVEAAFDANPILQEPLVVDDDKNPKKWFPTGSETRPTASYLPTSLVPLVRVVPKANCGISAEETQLVRTASNFVADQAVALSGALLDALGSVHVGFIVGGNFSVGDSETVRAVAKTTIETATRRLVQRGAYEVAAKYNIDLAIFALLQQIDAKEKPKK
jgi:hypothetical protein